MIRQPALLLLLLLLVTAVVLVPAGAAAADDRALLNAAGPAPHLLVLLDAGATMVQDAASGQLVFPGSGDEGSAAVAYLEHVYSAAVLRELLGASYPTALGEGARLAMVKRGLQAFLDLDPGVNLGFSFTARQGLTVQALCYLYTNRSTTLEGAPAGTPFRLGGLPPGHGVPFYPVRFGADGTQRHLLWRSRAGASSGLGPYYGGWSDIDPGRSQRGSMRLVSYLVDRADLVTALPLSDARAAPVFYYPAADWSSLDPEIRRGLAGETTWERVAVAHEMAFHSDADQLALRDMVLAHLAAHQIGSQTLFMREDLEVWNGRTWVPSRSLISELVWQQELVLTDPATAPDRPGVSAVSFEEGCAAYRTTGQADEPIVPLGRPDPVTGAVPDQRWRLAPLLAAQPAPVFHFPTRQDGIFLPTDQRAWLPFSEAVIAAGRRPLAACLEAAGRYLRQTLSWPDPVAACRQRAVVLVTGGGETCGDPADACARALDLGRDGVKVFVVLVAGASQAADAGDTLRCIAELSGGRLLTATSAQELTRALVSISTSLEERTRGFAMPAVSPLNPGSSQTAFVASFTPKQHRSVWRGHLRAYPVSPVSGLPAGLRADGTPDPATALWDAGDTLALRPAETRAIYLGRQTTSGSGAAGDSLVVPVPRLRFTYPPGSSATAQDLRALLGSSMLGVEPWTGDNGDEDPVLLAALRGAIDFMRGEAMERDHSGGISRYGRDPEQYGWCGRVGDGDQDAEEPCARPGARVLGIEKLGDSFHAAPQLLAAPACPACWQRDLWGYRSFWEHHRFRRQVLLAGADDGSLHAFDAGLWDNDGAIINGEAAGPGYDPGTGRELFAWVPQSVLPQLGKLAYGEQHRWTVDGTVTIADVFVDAVFTGAPDPDDREWRTVVIFGQRRGGRSYVCLDLTRPDNDGGDGLPAVPGDLTVAPWTGAASTARDPACSDGTAAGCADEPWPELRWELTQDGVDADGNGAPDLGQTWSRPVVGFLEIDHDNLAGTAPEPRMVAIFGGGLDPDGLAAGTPSGTFLYGVDIETGQVLLRRRTSGMVAGEVSAVDLDLDGFLERLYWADTAGKIYRMEVAAPGRLDDQGLVSSWTPTVIFDGGPGQPFFQRPTLVPVAIGSDGAAVLAVAIGSGNRADLLAAGAEPHRLYVVVDSPDAELPITEASLHRLDLSSPTITESLLGTGAGRYGWYLVLDDDGAVAGGAEKVTTPATVVARQLLFSTFSPLELLPAGAGGDGDSCAASGQARTYHLALSNGNGLADGQRFRPHLGTASLAAEAVLYQAGDGALHLLQGLDNLALAEPAGAISLSLNVVSWEEQ